MKPTILCVDDEVDNIDALERLFRKKFNVLKASSGQEALQVLAKYSGPLAAIISDQRMPAMTGVEFLEKTLDSHPDTVRMLLTGYTDLESVISAVNKGQIFRYLTKPWDPLDLTNTVDRAVERYEVGQELKHKNIELEKAYDELKTLDTAKSNFMILVNHELKTPLTSVLNFNSLLAETKLDEEQTLYVDRIQKSADRLKTLIDDVLLVVKAEMGQLKPDLREVQIGNIVANLPKDLHQMAAKKNLVLTENFSSQKVYADTAQILQVLHRLIHNAVKFGNEGSKISIESALTGDSLTFTVSNEGKAISAEAIDKIFRPFFLDEDVMNHSAGVGLGLTICQSLLQVHGSGLNIKNHSNGVEVSFRLPSSANRTPDLTS
jgi:signal transduction histidine kinase